MKTTMICFLISIALQACDNGTTKTQSAIKENKKDIPADTVPVNKTTTGTLDENGCRAQQGEHWSMIKKTCIKLAEADIRLEPKHSTPDRSKPAYLLFSEDKIRVEIFLPTQKNSVVIRKSTDTGEADKWINGPLTLTQTDDSFALYDEGKLLYQGIKKD